MLSSVDDVTFISRKPSFAYNIHKKKVQTSVHSLIRHSIYCQESAISHRYTVRRIFLNLYIHEQLTSYWNWPSIT